MASEYETVEGILKELRGIKCGQHTNGGLSFERWRARCQFADDYADRFEVAHQREVGELYGERNGILSANASLASDNDRLRHEISELRECLEQAYGDKIGTYTMKGNEVERWREALKGASND